MALLDLLHPKLVHFPVALFSSALLLHIGGKVFEKEVFEKAAMYIYVLAAFFCLPTAASGLWEQNRLHLHHPTLYNHRNFALAVTIYAWTSLCAMWLCRSNPAAGRRIFAWSCWIATALVLAASYFGGELVYGYGVGVAP